MLMGGRSSAASSACGGVFVASHSKHVGISANQTGEKWWFNHGLTMKKCGLTMKNGGLTMKNETHWELNIEKHWELEY